MTAPAILDRKVRPVPSQNLRSSGVVADLAVDDRRIASEFVRVWLVTGGAEVVKGQSNAGEDAALLTA